MACKALKVQVDFNIHVISCPGVWLDSLEDVWLTIEMFGEKHSSSHFVPVFPLYIFEEHKFDKIFLTCFDPADVCDLLEGDHVEIKLMQKSYVHIENIVLAKLCSNTRRFLYPQPKLGPIYSRSQRELLMERTRHFRGTIAPKLEFSVTTIIKASNFPLRLESQYACESPRLCRVADGASLSQDLLFRSPTKNKCLNIREKCHVHTCDDGYSSYCTIPVFSPSRELSSLVCRKCGFIERDRMEREELPKLFPPLRTLPHGKNLDKLKKHGHYQSPVHSLHTYEGNISMPKIGGPGSLDSEGNSDEDLCSYFGDTYKKTYDLERYF